MSQIDKPSNLDSNFTTSSDIDLEEAPTTDLLLHQNEQPPPPYEDPRSRILENIALTAAYIHLNISISLLLSLSPAFSSTPLLHLLLWFPFLIGSARILYTSAWCRRQAFLCLAVSATGLCLVVMSFVVGGGMDGDGD